MFFLASGVGNIGTFALLSVPPQPDVHCSVGAPIAGYYADQAVIKGRARHEGQWVPEDRLRATLFGALVLVPLSVLISGLATQFIPGALGVAINVACLFANGIAVRLLVLPSRCIFEVLMVRSCTG